MLVTTAIVCVCVCVREREWMYFFVLQMLLCVYVCVCLCACAMVGRGWWAEKIGFWNVECARTREKMWAHLSICYLLCATGHPQFPPIISTAPFLLMCHHCAFDLVLFSAFLFSAIYFHVHGAWNTAAFVDIFLCFSRRFLRTHAHAHSTHTYKEWKWKGLHIKTHTNSPDFFDTHTNSEKNVHRF